MNILGLSAYYHDSAAVLLRDGEILAAAQEERFSRTKHDARFPAGAVRYCLREGAIALGDVDYVVFYEKPLLKFERLLQTYLAVAPRGFASFLAAMPVWLKEKLYLKTVLRRELAAIGQCAVGDVPPLLFTEHHQSHAASAFFPSPFTRADVLCLDAVGEWATTTTWRGEENRLTPGWQIDFPHSLGLLYSAFTYFCGFKVNSGEYKLMGLAPYGEPTYVDVILEHLIDLKDDGTFRLDMQYFSYLTGLTMVGRGFERLFGGPPRSPDQPLTEREMNLARSIQAVTEEIVLRLVRTLHREQGGEYLCLAGGVALNCVANGRVLRAGPYKDIWIQPAAGDAGGALGAALSVWHEFLGKPRDAHSGDRMAGALLGPAWSDQDIRAFLDSAGATYERLEDDVLVERTAELLDEGRVVGWFQGRMEFGPRALGNRSILADARNPEMQSVLNLKIKFRESFRPFAPAVPAEEVGEYFDLDRPSPYMLLTSAAQGFGPVKPPVAQGISPVIRGGAPTLPRLPAVTHVDGSARVQTVAATTNPRFHALLRAFRARTGCGVLVNTSFNVRGEPIVCGPGDAYRCFLRTGMDDLVLGNFLLGKAGQPAEQGMRASVAQGPNERVEQGFSPVPLRVFGLTLAGLVAIFFGILLPWRFDMAPGWWPWVVSGVLAFASLAVPALLGPLHEGWSWLGGALAWLNVRIVLGAAFVLVFAPVGLVRRVLRRDSLRLCWTREAATYRRASASYRASDMTRPF